MKLAAPFLTTSIETDLMMVFLLAPFWWLTGFGVFAYYALVFWIFLKFMLGVIRQYRTVLFPSAGNWFVAFLVSYLISILINIPFRDPQRIFSSLNNWLMFLMGAMVLLLVYNCDPVKFFRKLLRSCNLLCILTGILGVVILALWYKGIKINMPTLMGKMMPSLTDLPYFYGQLNIQGTVPDWLMGEDLLPRLTPYSLSPTATGGLVLMMLPAAAAYYTGRPRKTLKKAVVLALGLMLLAFSLSRSAIYGFVLATMLVFAIERGFSFLLSMGCAFSGFVASGLFTRLMEWIFNLRKSSSTGRLELLEEALRILFEENPLMGLGVRLREGFTMMAIGTHGGIYVEIIFTTGIVGLFFFFMFHASAVSQWFFEKGRINHPMHKTLWSHLGISLLAVHIWLLTDTIVAFPMIAYFYFLIVGATFLLRRTDFGEWKLNA